MPKIKTNPVSGAPVLQGGEPWNMEEMDFALNVLDQKYRANKAEKTINSHVSADYAALHSIVMQAVQAAKDGTSASPNDAQNISIVARQYASNCLKGCSVPEKLIADPVSGENANRPWPLSEMLSFLNQFSFVIYQRIDNPLGTWDDIKPAAVASFYDGYQKSVTSLLEKEADQIVEAITASQTYRDGDLLPEDKRAYLKYSLRDDLIELFLASEGMADCTPEHLSMVLRRITDVAPQASKTDMPRFAYPGEGVAKNPITLRAALNSYKDEMLKYDKEVKDLEAAAGPTIPDYTFDFTAYQNDIEKYFSVVNVDRSFYFRKMDEHLELIHRLVSYVQSNDAVLAPDLTPAMIIGDMCNNDFDVEYQLEEQLGQPKRDPRDGLRGVRGPKDRPVPTREYVAGALDYYATLPKKYLKEYVEHIAKLTIDEDFQAPKMKSRPFVSVGVSDDASSEGSFEDEEEDLNQSQYTDPGNKLEIEKELEKIPTFEQDVIDPILDFCEEEKLFDQQVPFSNGRTTQVALINSMNTLTRWMNTSRTRLGTIDTSTYGIREFKLNDDLTSDETVGIIRDVNHALRFMKTFTQQAGLQHEFHTSIADRRYIMEDLTALRDELHARHVMREFPAMLEQIETKNRENEKTKWSNLTLEELNTAKTDRETLLREAEQNITIMKDLIAKNISADVLRQLVEESKKPIENWKGQDAKLAAELDKKIKKEQELEQKRLQQEKKAEEKRRKEQLKAEKAGKKQKEEQKEEQKEDRKEDPKDEQKIEEKEIILDGNPDIIELDRRNIIPQDQNAQALEAEEHHQNIMPEADIDELPPNWNRREEEAFNPDTTRYGDSWFHEAYFMSERGKARDHIISIAHALRNEHHNEHEEFDRMKQALADYEAALKDYGYDGILPEEEQVYHPEAIYMEEFGTRQIPAKRIYSEDTERQIAADAALRAAAERVYITAVTYLEQHLDTRVERGRIPFKDDKLDKRITGQLTPSGRIRKQAAVALMDLLHYLPEAEQGIRTQDHTITYRNAPERVHSLDFADLKISLGRAVGRDNPYKDLMKEIRSQKSGRQKAWEHRRAQEQRQAANAKKKDQVKVKG